MRVFFWGGGGGGEHTVKDNVISEFKYSCVPGNSQLIKFIVYTALYIIFFTYNEWNIDGADGIILRQSRARNIWVKKEQFGLVVFQQLLVR